MTSANDRACARCSKIARLVETKVGGFCKKCADKLPPHLRLSGAPRKSINIRKGRTSSRPSAKSGVPYVPSSHTPRPPRSLQQHAGPPEHKAFHRRRALAQFLATHVGPNDLCAREDLRRFYRSVVGEGPQRPNHRQAERQRAAGKGEFSSVGSRSTMALHNDLKWMERRGATRRSGDTVQVVDWVVLLDVIRASEPGGCSSPDDS